MPENTSSRRVYAAVVEVLGGIAKCSKWFSKPSLPISAAWTILGSKPTQISLWPQRHSLVAVASGCQELPVSTRLPPIGSYSQEVAKQRDQP
jgi:hypothetical protein